jgi:hypothetical protein
MKLLSGISITLIFFFCSLVCIAQGVKDCNRNEFRKRVLAENILNKEFGFMCVNDGVDGEVDLTYLGVVGNKSKGYKIVRSTWIHGESRRATNAILVFDEQGKLLGNYGVTMIDDLPDKVESRELVFLNSAGGGCDAAAISRISFDKGIPAEIFVRCENDSGSLFSFSRGE